MSNDWPLMHHVYFLTVIKFALAIVGSFLKRAQCPRNLLSKRLFMAARARAVILPMLPLLQHLLLLTLEMNTVRNKVDLHLLPLPQFRPLPILEMSTVCNKQHIHLPPLPQFHHLFMEQIVTVCSKQEWYLIPLHQLRPNRSAVVVDSGLPWEPLLRYC